MLWKITTLLYILGCSDEDTVSILNMPLIGAVDGVMSKFFLPVT